MSVSRARKRNKEPVINGIACIKATFNNTFITITDTLGRVLVRVTAGSVGFKGARKSTPFAARVAAPGGVTLSHAILLQGLQHCGDPDVVLLQNAKIVALPTVMPSFPHLL